MGWQKAVHMGIGHQWTWKKLGWRSWQAPSPSTTSGTVSLERRFGCLAVERV